MRRTITVTLTDVQFNGLASAMGALDSYVDDWSSDNNTEQLAEVRAAHRAWAKIRSAWLAKKS